MIAFGVILKLGTSILGIIAATSWMADARKLEIGLSMFDTLALYSRIPSGSGMLSVTPYDGTGLFINMTYRDIKSYVAPFRTFTGNGFPATLDMFALVCPIGKPSCRLTPLWDEPTNPECKDLVEALLEYLETTSATEAHIQSQREFL